MPYANNDSFAQMRVLTETYKPTPPHHSNAHSGISSGQGFQKYEYYGSRRL